MEATRYLVASSHQKLTLKLSLSKNVRKIAIEIIQICIVADHFVLHQFFTGAEFCRLLYDFLTEQEIEEQLNQQLMAIAEEEQRMQTQEEWALVWNSFVEILEHLTLLYQEWELELPEFCAILSSLTSSIQRATPPRTLDAILISQGSTARLNAPKIVFLLGAEGHLEDEQADDDRRDGVEDRQAEARAEHARKAADGRQRIRAVMPCLGLERHGADALGGEWGLRMA